MFLIFLIIVFVSRIYATETRAMVTTIDNSSVTSEEVSFKTKITPICDTDPAKLLITGDIVKFSEIVKPDGSFDIQCGNTSNLTTVYIFAKKKVLIDQNIHARGFDLFILAPVWQVVTLSFINLIGLDGEYMSAPQPKGIGWDGVDGSPGNPGHPGGSFFGVGETFIDGKYLTIDVSGGGGGAGQDGGVGGPGTDGRHALKANLSLTCSHSACDGSGTQTIALADNVGNFTNFKCKEEYNYIIYDMFFLPPVSGNVRECSYYIYGSEGVVAGAGGDGGVGGMGGRPGHVYLLELFEFSEIATIRNIGRTGMGGRGAQGGDFSYSGLDVSFKKRETYSHESPHESGTPIIKYIDSHRIVKPDQMLGVDGKNTHLIKDPVHSELVGFSKLYNALAEFTKFFSDHK